MTDVSCTAECAKSNTRHIVLTDLDGRPVGRARIIVSHYRHDVPGFELVGFSANFPTGTTIHRSIDRIEPWAPGQGGWDRTEVRETKMSIHHPGYEIHDGRDENRQGWVLYRTPRGRVVARYATQWANVADRWTADPMEVAQIIASEGIDLDDRDRTILEVLEEVG